MPFYKNILTKKNIRILEMNTNNGWKLNIFSWTYHWKFFWVDAFIEAFKEVISGIESDRTFISNNVDY